MNGFTIYKEYYELITLLSKKEQQELLLAITEYMFEDIEPTLNERQMKIFNNLKRPLDKSKKRSNAGSKSTTKENQNENKTKTKENQNEIKKGNKTETHQDVNVSNYYDSNNYVVNVNGNVNVTVKKIIDYLNNKLNSNYKPTTKSTISKINARLNEGYTLDDFIAVINKKYDEWVGTEFEQYLCPETLFGTKFEKYLNQKNVTRKGQSKDITMEFLKGVHDGTIKVN